ALRGPAGAGRGAPLQLAAAAENASGAAAAFGCRRYGCVDERTWSACGCGAYCEEDGSCCPDYREACTGPTAEGGLLRGRWDGCPPGALPGWPRIGRPAARGGGTRLRVLSYNAELHQADGLQGASVAGLVEEGGPFDLLGFQGLDNPWRVLSAPGPGPGPLLEEYEFISGTLARPGAPPSASGTGAGACSGAGSATWRRTWAGTAPRRGSPSGPGSGTCLRGCASSS
ncbi:unnamed protein product, partial [Prorocentrum cordatum]